MISRKCGERPAYDSLLYGFNTPGIIKYPFWQMTDKNPEATYASVNYGEAVCPKDIREQPSALTEISEL